MTQRTAPSNFPYSTPSSRIYLRFRAVPVAHVGHDTQSNNPMPNADPSSAAYGGDGRPADHVALHARTTQPAGPFEKDRIAGRDLEHAARLQQAHGQSEIGFAQ